MLETQLSRRQIQLAVLVTVMLMACGLACLFTVLPSNRDPIVSQRVAIVSAIVAALAAVWSTKLVVEAARDKRRGIERAPAKVTGRFNIIFGGLVVVGGITCSAAAYFSAVAAGGGVWTIYYGVILWGIVHMFVGFRKLRNQHRAAPD